MHGMSYFANIRKCLACVRGRACPREVCVCPQDGRPIIPHALAADCPINLHVAGAAMPAAPMPAVIETPLTLHQLWRALHLRAAAFPLQPTAMAIALERRWLRAFERAIKCGGCRYHWGVLTADNPPPLTSREGYFFWTVDRHNDVSVEIGKPAWTHNHAGIEYGVIEPALTPV
jgi:hypothetical protein